jgi:hypothetical protein
MQMSPPGILASARGLNFLSVLPACAAAEAVKEDVDRGAGAARRPAECAGLQLRAVPGGDLNLPRAAADHW